MAALPSGASGRAYPGSSESGEVQCPDVFWRAPGRMGVFWDQNLATFPESLKENTQTVKALCFSCVVMLGDLGS